MTNKEILEHYNYLKEVYDSSSIKICFINHINKVFQDISYHSNNAPVFVYSNNQLTKVVSLDGFYPKYLEYKPEEISPLIFFVDTILAEHRISPLKHYIKKELLRKIFLFTLENIVSKHNFGIEFSAIHSVPINSIPFTIEYTGSGKMYRRFVDGSEKNT
jgi:hypothetical protein